MNFQMRSVTFVLLSVLIVAVFAACSGGGTVPSRGANDQRSLPVSQSLLTTHHELFVGPSANRIDVFDETTGVLITKISPPGVPTFIPTTLTLSRDDETLFATFGVPGAVTVPFSSSSSRDVESVQPLSTATLISLFALIDTRTHEIKRQYHIPAGFLEGSVSADGRIFAAVGQQRSGRFAVYIFDARTGAPVKSIELPESARFPYRLTLSSDGAAAYVTDSNNFNANVFRVNVAKGTASTFYAFPANRSYPIYRPALDSTNRMLYIGTTLGFTILDAKNGHVIGNIGTGQITSEYFDAAGSADQKTIVATGLAAANNHAIATIVSPTLGTITRQYILSGQPASSIEVNADASGAFIFYRTQLGSTPFNYIDTYSLPAGILLSHVVSPSTLNYISAVAGE